MLSLKELLRGVVTLAEGDDRMVAGVELDSRAIRDRYVFVALAGAKQHGMTHVGQAVSNGACAAIFDPFGKGVLLANNFADSAVAPVPLIPVENLPQYLGLIGLRFYGEPSRRMSVIGITGTNGKTSCSQFLSQLLDDCGIIGTLGWGEWGHLNATLNTTPDALAVQKILADFLRQKKTYVAMEVSSHGLEQGRVNGVLFKGAVYTNISRDHLDYHGTMDAYVEAKLALMRQPGLEFAVVNADDAYSERIVAVCPETVRLWRFSANGKMTDEDTCVGAENLHHYAGGIEFDVRWQGQIQHLKLALYGDFNVENVLAVLTVLLALGFSLSEAVAKVEKLKPVEGRMERFGSGPSVFVDYAHTPDALEKVLSGLRKHCEHELWVVFGCGGNRDKGKRPQMGKIAETWADRIVITDDNPRFENGEAIVNDILSGCSTERIEVVRNRASAISDAIINASENDCIVIAGKGHEQYQEIEGLKTPFCDREVVLKALALRRRNSGQFG